MLSIWKSGGGLSFKEIMKRKLYSSLLSLVGLGALTLSSCLQMEQKFVVNPDKTGKCLVKVEMVNPMEMLGGLGALGGEGPSPEDMADGFAKGMLGGAIAAEAWSDVKWGVTEEGKMQFTGVAYYNDFTKFTANPGGAGGDGMSMESDIGGELTSTIRDDGMWVIGMDMTMEEAGGDEPAGEPVPADQIDQKLKEQRMQWQAMKGVMGMFLTEMKFDTRVKVAGEIQSVSNFEKMADDVAGISVDGSKILEGMEAIVMDDDFMKKALAEGNLDEDGMPSNLPPDMAAKMLFGERGPVEIVVKPGEPIFDYEAEVEAAKAAMTPELKQMIEEGRAEAEAAAASAVEGLGTDIF